MPTKDEIKEEEDPTISCSIFGAGFKGKINKIEIYKTKQTSFSRIKKKYKNRRRISTSI